MGSYLTKVNDYLVPLDDFIYSDEKIEDNINKIASIDIDEIAIVDHTNTYQGSVKKSDIFANPQKDLTFNDIIKKYKKPIITYPQSAADVAMNAMYISKATSLPVVNNHLDKKLIGIVKLSDLSKRYQYLYS